MSSCRTSPLPDSRPTGNSGATAGTGDPDRDDGGDPDTKTNRRGRRVVINVKRSYLEPTLKDGVQTWSTDGNGGRRVGSGDLMGFAGMRVPRAGAPGRSP